LSKTLLCREFKHATELSNSNGTSGYENAGKSIYDGHKQ